MTDAEKVVKALRVRCVAGAGFDRPAGDDVAAEYDALADFVAEAEALKVRCGVVLATRYDAVLARLREVLNG